MPRINLISLVNINKVRQDKAAPFSFVATEGECQILAERFGFVAVKAVEATFSIRKSARDCWDVEGHLSGVVVQACGVTGAPVSETVDFLIEERYVRSTGDQNEVEVSLDGTEPLQDDNIDVGEMLAQSLAIAVTAWPRAVDAPETYTTDEEPSDHPFAGLAALKNRRPE